MTKEIQYPWSDLQLDKLDIPIESIIASTNIKCNSSFISVKLTEQDTFETHVRSVTPSLGSIASKVSIVFLHGASFSSKNWDEDLNTLAIFGALGYHTFALDLPGNCSCIKCILIHLVLSLFLIKYVYRIWKDEEIIGNDD